MSKKVWGALALFLSVSAHAVAEEETKKIADNSFLLEEAYNQEKGVVQHIQSFMYMHKTHDWAYTFTQEWPFFDETHQLSYTIPINRVSDPSRTTGLGDILLNYRYQAILKDKVAFSPRLSIILPTGDYKDGLGTDSVGIQANLPLSLEIGDNVVTHWNLGATYTPNSKEPGGG